MLLRYLNSTSPGVAAAACNVVGVAAANNPQFQTQLMAAFPPLLSLLQGYLGSSHPKLLLKALYATGALVRNQQQAREAFYVQVGPRLGFAPAEATSPVGAFGFT